eukprot:4151121-Amphidinium_carterae.1
MSLLLVGSAPGAKVRLVLHIPAAAVLAAQADGRFLAGPRLMSGLPPKGNMQLAIQHAVTDQGH